MWARQSHLLQPLTALTSYKVTFEWAHIEQKAFEDIKFIVACNNLLAYPDFNEQFDIHTDDSDYHLGAIISQYGKSIAF